MCVCVCAHSLSLCGMLSSCGCCAFCPESGKKAGETKEAPHMRSFTSASQRRWLQSRAKQSRRATCCMPMLAGQQLLHFEANEKQFWCSNYVCQKRAAVLSLLPQSFVLHMTKMLAASVKDCTKLDLPLHTMELPTRHRYNRNSAQHTPNLVVLTA